MRALGCAVLAVWLGLGAWRLALDGRARLAGDLRLARLSGADERRAALYGPRVGPPLAQLEALLDEVRREGVGARVVLAAPAPRNVYESLAWHLLQPAAVLPAGADEARELARARGASWCLVYDAQQGWRAERMEAGR